MRSLLNPGSSRPGSSPNAMDKDLGNPSIARNSLGEDRGRVKKSRGQKRVKRTQKYGRTEGRTDGRTDVRTDGWTDGRTDGRAGGRGGPKTPKPLESTAVPNSYLSDIIEMPSDFYTKSLVKAYTDHYSASYVSSILRSFLTEEVSMLRMT